MGKRSNFERNPMDFYPTPLEAVFPLLGHIRGTTFIEPCAGDGRLIRHLEQNGLRCTYACDIEPQPCDTFMQRRIHKKDVLFFDSQLPPAEQIITNSPWGRPVLHSMIDIFRIHAPTWLLIDAAWMFTGQAKPYLAYCNKIVSVGRVSWMDNGQSGMDDCCWYAFGREPSKIEFVS